MSDDSCRHCTISSDRSLTTGRQCRIAPNEQLLRSNSKLWVRERRTRVEAREEGEGETQRAGRIRREGERGRIMMSAEYRWVCLI